MFQGHDLDVEHIAKECGDCLWYLAILAKGAGYTLDEIAEEICATRRTADRIKSAILRNFPQIGNLPSKDIS